MRERGLKFAIVQKSNHAALVAPHAGAWIEIGAAQCFTLDFGSLPMRERGLKSACTTRRYKEPKSLPMRERGLKFSNARLAQLPIFVAPHAGAWIEIFCPNQHKASNGGSLPMRERGLKYHRQMEVNKESLVAPHAGAWIEISRVPDSDPGMVSLPMRERGLK